MSLPPPEKLATPAHLSVGCLLKDSELVQGQGLAQQIYQLLWKLIVNIELQPGQLVSEKEIAESLQSSKTPVREALIRLEETGLVFVVPKSGTYVTPIRINTYIGACFIRLQLECGAVRRAASQQTQRNSQLMEIIDQQRQALDDEDFSLFFTLDERLHEAFFIVAGMPSVWHVVKRTQSEVYRMRKLKQMFRINRRAMVLTEHRAIVDAIQSGDPDEAQNALIRHIGSLEGELQELSALPELLAFIEESTVARQRLRSNRL